MNLYVIRHGQTDWNLQSRFQGHIDTPLNETGKSQAKELANKLKDVDIDLIITSPLSRALNTAKAVNNDRNLPIIIDNNLIERSFGDFEGLDNISQYNCNINMLLNYNLNYSQNNVEPIQSLFKRVKAFLEYCVTTFPDKNVLLSTHGGIVQAVECILSNLPLDTDLQSLSLGNCEYRKYSDITKEMFEKQIEDQKKQIEDETR